MAKKSRYEQWAYGGQKLTSDTKTFDGFVTVDQNNKRLANPQVEIVQNASVPKMAQSFGAADKTDVAPTEKYDPAYAEWYAKYGAKPFTQQEYDAANGVVRNQNEFDSLYRSEDGTINGVVRDREKWNERNGVIGTYADYAKRLGVAEQKQQADAAYDRAIPTYGAQAEQLAQAGIHGGYGEYLASQAYATMQNQKYAIDKAARESYADYARTKDQEYARQMQEANTAFKQHQHEADAGYAAYLARIREANDAAYQEYTVAQEAQAKADKQARDARVGSLYTRLAKESYTDANGETVQGYGLESVTNDDKYAAAKEQYRQELVNMGATEDEVDEALARVDKQRDSVIGQIRSNGENIVKDFVTSRIADGEDAAASAKFAETFGYTPDDGDSPSKVFIKTLDYAVDQGYISPETRSAALKDTLPINEYKDEAREWKAWGEVLYDSADLAIELGKDGSMQEDDVKAVLDEVVSELGFTDLWYDVENRSLKITVDGKTIEADHYGSYASEAVADYLNKNYSTVPIAIYDGTLYFQKYNDEGRLVWDKLKTKGGQGVNQEMADYYFKTVALVMMQNKEKYKISHTPVKGEQKVETQMYHEAGNNGVARTVKNANTQTGLSIPTQIAERVSQNLARFPSSIKTVGYNVKTGNVTYRDENQKEVKWEHK